MMKLLQRATLGAVLALLILTGTAQAAVFDVLLSVDLFGAYDDNVLLTDGDEEESFIFQIRPILELNHERPHSSVHFRAVYFYERYENDNLPEKDNEYFLGFVDTTWDVSENFTVGLYDEARDSIFGVDRIETPRLRQDYIENQLRPSVRYHQDDRLSLEFFYENRLQEYDHDPVQFESYLYGFVDWMQHKVGLDGSIRLLTDTDLTAGIDGWSRRFDDDMVSDYSNASGYQARIGVDQKLGQDRMLKAWVTYDHMGFKEAQPGLDKDYDEVGGEIEFENRFSGVTWLELGVFSNYAASEKITASYYRSTGVRAKFRALIRTKVEASCDLTFARLEYQNIPDPWEDQNLRAGFTVGYRVQDWLSTRVRYQYSQRTSDRPNDDYADNMAAVYLHFHTSFFN